METRAPPIGPRTCTQDRPQPQKPEEVTLPPLPPLQQQKQEKQEKQQKQQEQASKRRRPYKVLGIGATPLMHACQQADRPRVLRLLREQEETIGYRDRALRSALHYCMDAGTGGALAQAAPELVDSPDAEGHTPLHLAVIAGDAQLVAVLLASGADVNAKDLEGHSVLHWATVCGEVECVRLVLAAGARPSTADLRGGSPLHYAAQCCGAAATAELAVPKKVGLKVLQTLLEFGAEVNARDEDGRQPILWAASAGSVEAVLALVRAGGSAVAAASDKDGLTALHCAASRGHARCIEALVKLCDAQPDHVDDNGCSALHYAATLGHADATALLLKLGAEPNRQDRKGRTPALCAAAKGQLETLKILAQHGGSLQARTVRGTGVAHEAVASGRLELLKWLARRRPSLLDLGTHDGKTPLHVAALHGHLDACKLLLDAGARVNALMRSSKQVLMTALDAALYRGHRDCAKLLQLHGGTTAQQLRSRKPAGPAKVFAAKLRLERADTSSDSELNEASPRRRRLHRHREPELYYEERWTERRTRRRATNRRRLSRQDSRSFSEEELRHTKSSSQSKRAGQRQRRALSENARYADDVDSDHQGLLINDEKEFAEGQGRRKRRKSEKQSKRRKNEQEQLANESESEEAGPSSKSDEESATVTDDSLEVVVVRRSLEKKSEKIVSGRKSKAARELEKDAKVSSRCSKSELKKSWKKEQEKYKEEVSAKTQKVEASKRRASNQDEKAFDGDSTSQDTVEEMTVTADVHKNEAPDSSREKKSCQVPDSQEKVVVELEAGEQVRNKMDDILEKADELQNALMSKAADLRKDMEEVRQQMSQRQESEEHNVKEEKKSEAESATTCSESNSHDLSSVKESSPRDEISSEKKVGPPDESSIANKVDKMTKDLEETEKTTEENEKLSEQVGKNDKEEIVKDETKRNSVDEQVSDSKTEFFGKEIETLEEETKAEVKGDDASPRGDESKTVEASEHALNPPVDIQIPGTEGFRYADESSSSSARASIAGKGKPICKAKSPGSSEERSPDRSAIVAVIESPEWDEEEELDEEIRQAIGGGGGGDEEDEEDEEEEEESDGLGGADDDVGIVRVLPSTSEEDVAARGSLPQLRAKSYAAGPRQRRDSGGRDSGIEPSPRVSRIPRRTGACYPNSERQHALHMDTITRDVQISLRRYHLERKIFFQLMELKRLQIRHGRANEQVLVKRQVEAFHKAGMSGPALGVARYDHQPFTFRHFESFLYEQLRRLQRRPSTPDWCTEAKQCTQKTHRCHHATSAYTSVPIYTYLAGGAPERPSLLPRIEGRGKGQMTVEVTHGEEKQVIALPSEKLDRTKRYYVTFTVRGDTTDSDKSKTPINSANLRNTKSV